MSKIDCAGNFLPFRGVTIISSTNDEDAALWERLYTSLNSTLLIRNHYSLLPYESYHMTLNNLYTEEEIGSANWDEFIRENRAFFRNLNYIVSMTGLTPEVTITDEVTTKNVIQLQFSLSDEQIKLIESISNSCGIQNRLPYSYHMTLAYEIPSSPIIDREATSKVREAVLGAVTEIFSSRTIGLKQPRLCYFNSMEAFVPWDGSTNPFVSLASHSIFVGQGREQGYTKQSLLNIWRKS